MAQPKAKRTESLEDFLKILETRLSKNGTYSVRLGVVQRPVKGPLDRVIELAIDEEGQLLKASPNEERQSKLTTVQIRFKPVWDRTLKRVSIEKLSVDYASIKRHRAETEIASYAIGVLLDLVTATEKDAVWDEWLVSATVCSASGLEYPVRMRISSPESPIAQEEAIERFTKEVRADFAKGCTLTIASCTAISAEDDEEDDLIT